MSSGARIRELRERQGWSQRRLADKIGIKQQSLNAIESGKVLKSKYLPDLARALGVPLESLDPNLEAVDAGEVVILPRMEIVGGKDLPVYGSAEGGQGAMIVSVEPVEYVMRPGPLASVKDGYAIIIVGESMEPELWSGDFALIHPHLPPAPGSTHIFYGLSSDGSARVLAKHLLRVTATEWHVRQWNPQDGQERDFRLSRAEWPKCHLIIGKYSRR